jgi:hypothetical protein
VNRTCKTFCKIISNTHVLWEDFEFDHEGQLSITEVDLERILQHSIYFRKCIFPPFSLKCEGFEIDFYFSRYLKSKKLYWLTLTDLPISTLCFIKNTPNIQILDLSGCTNLIDDDFRVLKKTRDIDQLYLSFTNITGKTLIEIVCDKTLIVLDVCGVRLSLENCKTILHSCFSSLLTFHLSLEEDVTERQFNEEVRNIYRDIAFHVYRK